MAIPKYFLEIAKIYFEFFSMHSFFVYKHYLFVIYNFIQDVCECTYEFDCVYSLFYIIFDNSFQYYYL